MRTIDSPEEMQKLMKECIEVTHHYIDVCNSTFGLRLPHYKVLFSLKGTTAGKALIGRGVIQYNPTLLRENPDDFLKRTCGHEVVHHAAYSKHGYDIDAHGSQWKAMMVRLGLPASRCHSYDTSNVPTRVGRIPRHQSPIAVPTLGQVKAVAIGKVIEFD